MASLSAVNLARVAEDRVPEEDEPRSLGIVECLAELQRERRLALAADAVEQHEPGSAELY